MTRARLRALLASLVLIVIGALAFAKLREPAPVPSSERAQSTLLLLTSLPIMFADDFSLEGGSPALTALRSRYRVTSISVTSAAELAKGRLLLMAQPQAQPPENLVALDHWVRAGGHVVLLADPMLEWPSKRPLGDRLRPPIMFTDTGLLSHWGLRLDAPDERGQASMRLGNYSIISASPGQLFGTTCRISPDHLLAQCRIGSGRATVIADADFLNVDGLGAGASQNLEALLAQLKAIT
jgi:Domain of unknown function (DUF4350)